jgi:hypothetical protein
MNQLVTQIETTKVLADRPRKPKRKAATVIVFFLTLDLPINVLKCNRALALAGKEIR